MSLKEWKDNEINTKLMKKWGLLKEDKSKELEQPPEGPGDPGYKEEEELDEDQAIFAPNHYCVHHGGVQHEGKIKMAEAVNHNFNRELNRVTHYDMKLADGTLLEAVAAEDIQVVRASLAEEHSHEEGCPPADDIGIDAGGDVPVDDVSQLSPEEAFAAGMAAAKEAIDNAIGGGGPPEGGFGGSGPMGEPGMQETKEISRKISVREAKEVTRRILARIRKENN